MAENIINHNIREKIQTYIKNKIDISDLIRGMSIKGENLNRAIITDLYRVDTDISGCSFAYATIGCSDKITTLIRTNMQNCNWEGCKFIGKTWMRHCDARNNNFEHADVHLVSYEYTDFRGSSFCNSIITIGTRGGTGCHFPISMFEDLCKGWKMKIKAEEIQ